MKPGREIDRQIDRMMKLLTDKRVRARETKTERGRQRENEREREKERVGASVFY